MHNTTEPFAVHNMSEVIVMYLTPVVFVIGLLTNTLATITLRRKTMRSSSIMLYLTVLVIADSVVLCIGLLPFWIKKTFAVDIRTLSPFTCKMFAFLTYYVTDFCNWIILAINIDRFIAVCVPQKYKTLCTKSMAYKMVILDLVVMFLINAHLLGNVTTLPDPETEGIVCDIDHYIGVIWSWVDFCLYFFIPFFVMTVCNGLIIHKLSLSKKNIDSLASHVQLSTSYETGTNTKPVHVVRPDRRISKLSRTLLAINLVFFILTVPIVVFNIYMSHIATIESTEPSETINLTENLVTILEFSNNSVHFFVYCLTIPKFRTELHLFFKKHPRSSFYSKRSVAM